MASPHSKDRGASAVLALDEYEDRDPGRINQHLQLLWEDVVAEPDGVRSPDVTWRGSARLFRLSRDLVYAFLSCFLGPPIAVVLGGGFAVIAFAYIWCVAPVLRACRVTLGALNALVRAVTHATLAPVTEALGYVLANIRVRVQTAEAGRRAPSATSQPLLGA
ncbi:caveolin-2-like [Frankliniella occidentalis]|uniref:Caveolin n=1 Tax=Frankliniella occidentalis TaxID=133901 RepID=A0A9C6TXC6_FRAOC|nr:caveolin-2-like [Frankliniella occidentalis]